MEEKYTIVGIRFNKYSATYHYKCPIYIEPLNVKDLVVVCVNGEYKVVEVTHINVVEKINPKFEYQWIIQWLDTESYLKRRKACRHPTRL